MDLLIATRNAGKLAELAALLGGLPVRVLSLRDFDEAPDVVEDGVTLEENAAKKACQTADACGVTAVADDSGLFVDALGGAPGVHSARYAGPGASSGDLCRKLLAAMAAVPDRERTAHFACRIAMALPGEGVVLTASGSCEGVITREPRGNGGFGYDPVFFYAPFGKTFAEVPAAEKNRASHRGRALEGFRSRLTAYLETTHDHA